MTAWLKVARPLKLISLASSVALVVVVAGVVVSSSSSSSGAPQARDDLEALTVTGHPRGHSPLAFSESGDAESKWTTQPPGGRAVAHFPDGQRVRSRRLAKHAPRAEVHFTGVQAAEPTLGINKKGTIFTVGFTYEGNSPRSLKPPILRSTDGGATWKDVSPRLGPEYRHAVSLDPFVYVDDDTGRVFTADIQAVVGCSAMLSFTDNDGESWTTTEVCGLTDHQNIFAGPPATSQTLGYPNVVYYCAIDGGLLAAFGTMTSCVKSLDGGLTWTRTGQPAFHDDPRVEGGQMGIPGHCGGATGHGFVDDKGTVYLPRGYCGQPYLAISKNEGLTWKRVKIANNGMPFDKGSELDEHEAGVAVDNRGNIYYVWTARNRLPYLAISRNGGKTFSKPMMIGAPGITEAWGPTITVGAKGKVAIGYIGSRNAPGGRAPQGYGKEYKDATWHGFITMSTDMLARRPVFYSGQVSAGEDPLIKGSCGIIRCQQEFDFLDIDIGPDGSPYASMVDGCPPQGKCPSVGMGIITALVGGPSLR